jgi:hypothetical protein
MKVDLAATNRGDNTVSILLGIGDGTFMKQILYAVNNNPTSLVSGDLNSDGRPDLVVVDTLSNDVAVLLNQCKIISK